MFSMIKGAIGAITNWLFKGVEDQYVVIPHAAPKGEVANEIPQSLRERDIPDFGSDQERMLQMAVKNFSSEDLQVKWLHSMYQLRFKTSLGWIGERSGRNSQDRRYDKPSFLRQHPEVFTIEDAYRVHYPKSDCTFDLDKVFEEINRQQPVSRPGLKLVQ